MAKKTTKTEGGAPMARTKASKTPSVKGGKKGTGAVQKEKVHKFISSDDCDK